MGLIRVACVWPRTSGIADLLLSQASSSGERVLVQEQERARSQEQSPGVDWLNADSPSDKSAANMNGLSVRESSFVSPTATGTVAWVLDTLSGQVVHSGGMAWAGIPYPQKGFCERIL